jgi:hypothetical protein
MLRFLLITLLLSSPTVLSAQSDYRERALSHVKSCFARYTGAQVKDILYEVTPLGLGRADIANEISWRGVVSARYLVMYPNSKSWSEDTVSVSVRFKQNQMHVDHVGWSPLVKFYGWNCTTPK